MGCDWSQAVLGAGVSPRLDLPGSSGHSHPNVPFLNSLIERVSSLPFCVRGVGNRGRSPLQPTVAQAQVGVGSGRGGAFVFSGISK